MYSPKNGSPCRTWNPLGEAQRNLAITSDVFSIFVVNQMFRWLFIPQQI